MEMQRRQPTPGRGLPAESSGEAARVSRRAEHTTARPDDTSKTTFMPAEVGRFFAIEVVSFMIDEQKWLAFSDATNSNAAIASGRSPWQRRLRLFLESLALLARFDSLYEDV
jgi:hypothetical protein